jgi:glutathionyl-hydroquinone reductase
MGLLVDGEWHDRWYATAETGGRFVRAGSQFRNWVTRDGSPGPSGGEGFTAEVGRYHLYISLACPWAHRTLILRALKGLDQAISLSVVHWRMLNQGWTFEDGPGVLPDPINNAAYLHQVYTAADPTYSGRVTVPVLWDKQRGTIVSNESSEIIRMLNSAFDGVGALSGDYYPASLRDEIDAVNARIYESVNNGVYRAGFATTQTAYDEAIGPLFETLDRLEARLSKQRYLVCDRVTEADIRLFTTLVRFDAVYFGHFKCNLRQIADYPALWAYARDLYQTPSFGSTTDLEHAKRHYYESHRTINPTGVVPAGPVLDWAAPHGRERVGALLDHNLA